MVARKETDIAKGTEKSQCVVMSREQRAVLNRDIKMGNTFFGTLSQFKHLQTTAAG